MKKSGLLLILVVVLFACKKEDPLTKHDTYREVVYQIQTADSNLLVNLMRAVYDDEKRGNIGKDTILVDTGTYNIPATVFTGIEVALFGMSTISDNFDLKILDKQGNVLAETDSITYDPPNQANPLPRYRARVSFKP